MRPLTTAIVFGLLGVVTGPVFAASRSFKLPSRRVLPVLVHVDAHGKVTDVAPARRLRPKLDRLMRISLDRLVRGPAHVHGRPVDSQLVINLALQATPRQEGGYKVRFVYLSTQPVPDGEWYWVHIDGRQLALAEQSAGSLLRRRSRFWRPHPHSNWHPQPSSNSQPAVQASPASAPAMPTRAAPIRYIRHGR